MHLNELKQTLQVIITSQGLLKINLGEGRQRGLAAKILTLNTWESHMGAGSNPLWPGKAVEDGPKPWDSAFTWET